MKTLKKNSKIIRAKESDVNRYLTDGFEYCPKSEWKQMKNKPKVEVETEDKVEQPKRKKKKK